MDNSDEICNNRSAMNFLLGKNFTDCNVDKQIMCYEGSQCVRKSFQCNFRRDCPKYEDEKTCKLTVQNVLENDNRDKHCRIKYSSLNELLTFVHFPYLQLKNCRLNCSKSEYKCLFDNYCIPIDRVCDGLVHCYHGDDELSCGNYISKGFFKCRNESIYLADEQLCNHRIDCKYGSDEILCSSKNSSSIENCQISSGLNLFCENNNRKTIKFVNVENNYKKFQSNGGILFKKSNYLKFFTVVIIENNEFLFKSQKIVLNNIFILKILNSKIFNLSFIESENFLFKLQTLNVSNCSLTSMKFFRTKNLINLINLDLSRTKINYFVENIFKNLPNIKLFKFEYSNLFSIHKKSFNFLNKLEEIYLKNTFFKAKYSIYFIKNLIKIKTIVSEKFQLCCLAWKIYGKNVVCSPKPSGFFTCKNLIPNFYVKILFWFFGLSGIIGNLYSFIILFYKEHSSFLYRLSIAFGDFLTSIYMFAMAIADQYYTDEKYLKYEEEWRNGMICSFLGTMLTFGLFLTLNSILIIAMERYESISRPFNIPEFKKKRYFITAMLFIYCFSVAVIPVFIYNVKIFFFFNRKWGVNGRLFRKKKSCNLLPGGLVSWEKEDQISEESDYSPLPQWKKKTNL